MSIVDALALAPISREHAAPPRSRRHALVALVYVSILTLLTYRGGVYVRLMAGDAFGVVMPMFFQTVAVLAYAVRRGRLRIDAEGVRWGWVGVGFRMRRERIGSFRVYTDGVAIVPRRGPATWHLLARDWERWPDALVEFGRLGLPVERFSRRAPLLMRLQGYGRALDAILVLNSLAATLMFFGG
jgi:hypothetical protein